MNSKEIIISGISPKSNIKTYLTFINSLGSLKHMCTGSEFIICRYFNFPKLLWVQNNNNNKIDCFGHIGSVTTCQRYWMVCLILVFHNIILLTIYQGRFSIQSFLVFRMLLLRVMLIMPSSPSKNYITRPY